MCCLHISAVSHTCTPCFFHFPSSISLSHSLSHSLSPLPLLLLPYSLPLRQQVQFEHLRCHHNQTLFNAHQLLLTAAPRVQQAELDRPGLHVCWLRLPHWRHRHVQPDTERVVLKQRAHALRLLVPHRRFERTYRSALLFAGENAPVVWSLRRQQVGQRHGRLLIGWSVSSGGLQRQADHGDVVQGGGHLERKYAQPVPGVQARCDSPGSPP